MYTWRHRPPDTHQARAPRHNQHMTHEQRYRTAPSPDGSSPVAMQARTTPLGTRRAANSRTVRPMPLRSVIPTPPTPPLATATTAAVSSCAQKDRQHRAERRRSMFLTSGGRPRAGPRRSPPASARCAVGRPSAPAAAAPPHHAPAAAVERLGKARRRAPFVYPATVQGRVSGRIGPLVLGSRRCGQAAEQEPGP